MFQKYLDQFQIKQAFPEGTEVFLGITLVMKDGKFTQKSMFGKVQGLDKTTKKKPKDTKKYDEGKQIAKSLGNTKLQEMDDNEW